MVGDEDKVVQLRRVDLLDLGGRQMIFRVSQRRLFIYEFIYLFGGGDLGSDEHGGDAEQLQLGLEHVPAGDAQEPAGGEDLSIFF